MAPWNSAQVLTMTEYKGHFKFNYLMKFEGPLLDRYGSLVEGSAHACMHAEVRTYTN